MADTMRGYVVGGVTCDDYVRSLVDNVPAHSVGAHGAEKRLVLPFDNTERGFIF